MNQIDRITQVIFRAMDELNQQLPAGRKLEKSSDSVLYDRGGPLDSLQLVNLIVATEEEIAAEFGTVVVLADEKAVARGQSPFRTVGSFAEFIARRLEEDVKCPRRMSS